MLFSALVLRSASLTLSSHFCACARIYDTLDASALSCAGSDRWRRANRTGTELKLQDSTGPSGDRDRDSSRIFSESGVCLQVTGELTLRGWKVKRSNRIGIRTVYTGDPR